jgi:hypothetical protein
MGWSGFFLSLGSGRFAAGSAYVDSGDLVNGFHIRKTLPLGFKHTGAKVYEH